MDQPSSLVLALGLGAGFVAFLNLQEPAQAAGKRLMDSLPPVVLQQEIPRETFEVEDPPKGKLQPGSGCLFRGSLTPM